MRLVLGSRGSALALYQAEYIAGILRRDHDHSVEIKIIKTAGDKIDHLAFDQMEGKGFFTKELEDALLAGTIDLAVHSLKDLMTEQPEGLKLGAAGHRASRSELLLIHPEAYEGGSVLPFKDKAVVGTSSARRKCQVWHHRPDARIKDLRGNVPTRVNKLREKQYDAIVLATAGVERLGLDMSDLKVCRLDPLEFLPAPAQGILGIQIRADDSRVEEAVSVLNSAHDAEEAALERGLLARFESGCSLPLGVYSEYSDKGCRLAAVLGVREGGRWVSLRRTDITGDDVASVVAAAYLALTEDRR